MAKKKHISAPERSLLTAEDLKRYEAGEMSAQEMHRVEKILLEQPFYADAAEGFSEIRKDNVSADKNLNDLKARLGNRINQPSSQPKPVFTITRIWKPISIAAALLLVFGGTYYLIDTSQNAADTALIQNLEKSADNLPVPAASEPVAKEDKTATSKEEVAPKLFEKQKQTIQSSNQAQAVIRESEPLAVEEKKAEVILNNEADKTIAETPPPTPAASPVQAPATVQKKSVVDKDEAPVENRAVGGAARLAGASISGIVVNEDNEPMKDVTVNIKGRADGIRTNEEGKFSLRDARRGDIVIFNSSIMPQMELPLNNLPNRIVYSEENIKLPNKPKISVSSPNEVMFEKTATDAKPEFGWEAFEVYLKENTKRPPKALQANIEGRVIVNFMVNEKGELSDFTIIRSLGHGCDEEAIRIIKNGPKWFPATKDDKPVSNSKQVIVRFK